MCFIFSSHSFGYDCSQRNNLHAIDARTLAFVTGNLVHFLDPVSKIHSREVA